MTECSKLANPFPTAVLCKVAPNLAIQVIRLPGHNRLLRTLKSPAQNDGIDLQNHLSAYQLCCLLVWQHFREFIPVHGMTGTSKNLLTRPIALNIHSSHSYGKDNQKQSRGNG
jgi:hypothetical protein